MRSKRMPRTRQFLIDLARIDRRKFLQRLAGRWINGGDRHCRNYVAQNVEVRMEHRHAACADRGHVVRVFSCQRAASPLAAQTASLCSVIVEGLSGSTTDRVNRS